MAFRGHSNAGDDIYLDPTTDPPTLEARPGPGRTVEQAKREFVQAVKATGLDLPGLDKLSAMYLPN